MSLVKPWQNKTKMQNGRTVSINLARICALALRTMFVLLFTEHMRACIGDHFWPSVLRPYLCFSFTDHIYLKNIFGDVVAAAAGVPAPTPPRES